MKKKPTGKKPAQEVPASFSEAINAIKIKKETHRTTPMRLAKFLLYLLECGNVRQACRLAKIDHVTIYNHKKINPKFAEAYDEAIAIAMDRLEGEIIRRATDGFAEPIYYLGKKVGTIQKYSDTLAIFLLKGRKKETYGDAIKHLGDPDAPLQFEDIGREAAIAKIFAVITGESVESVVAKDGGGGKADSTVVAPAGPANPRPRK